MRNQSTDDTTTTTTPFTDSSTRTSHRDKPSETTTSFTTGTFRNKKRSTGTTLASSNLPTTNLNMNASIPGSAASLGYEPLQYDPQASIEPPDFTFTAAQHNDASLNRAHPKMNRSRSTEEFFAKRKKSKDSDIGVSIFSVFTGRSTAALTVPSTPNTSRPTSPEYWCDYFPPVQPDRADETNSLANSKEKTSSRTGPFHEVNPRGTQIPANGANGRNRCPSDDRGSGFNRTSNHPSDSAIFKENSKQQSQHQNIFKMTHHRRRRQSSRPGNLETDDISADAKQTEINSSSLARSAYDAVAKEAENMLSGKTFDQLLTLQEQIQRKLASNEPMDIEYWEGLLKALTVWKAKAKLKDMHQSMLQKRLEQLRAAQRLDARKEQNEVAAALAGEPLTTAHAVKAGVVPEEEDGDDEEEAVAAVQAQMIPYERGMSPEPFDGISQEDRELRVVDPQEDWKQLLERRREVEKNKLVPLKSQQMATEENTESGEPDISSILYSKEATKPADLDELVFNTEAELAKTTYLWQDKYRPRKPRYFNRVHTGYEWNKYNQTHYDTDNPPPKVVQGYKFNIFYPDLINKNKTPTYRIEKEPGTAETVLIRFIGGPPYEDIAFRVVNREWEYSHKKGFKSSFDRGVLQLHFHFKRNFYRK